jgi:general secretion pathway protein J
MNRITEGRSRIAGCEILCRCKNRKPKSEIRNQKSNGFTLIEVLLAMAILAVVMTVIYASFSAAGRDVKQAEAIRDETDLARTLISRISDDIANAYVNRNMNSSARITIFDGEKEEVENGSEKIRHDSITLTTLTHWRKPDSKEMELWEVGYFFKEKPDGSGYTLFRREKRELSKDVPALEGGDEYEITDNVESLQFRYYDGFNWTDVWDPSLSKVPTAVEIALTLDTGKVYVTQVDVGSISQ